MLRKNINADVVETRLYLLVSVVLLFVSIVVIPYFLGFHTFLDNYSWGLIVALCAAIFNIVLWSILQFVYLSVWTERLALWLAKTFALRRKRVDWWFDLENSGHPKQVLLYHNIKLGKVKLVEITHCERKLISEIWLYGSSFVATEKYCHPLPLWLSWLLRS